MIAASLHAQSKPNIPRWTRKRHFGFCAQSCGCCRAEKGDFLGTCFACEHYTKECERVFKTISAFMSDGPEHEIHSLRSLEPWGKLHPEIVQRIYDFLKDPSWTVDMRAGTAVAKLIYRIKLRHISISWFDSPDELIE